MLGSRQITKDAFPSHVLRSREKSPGANVLTKRCRVGGAGTKRRVKGKRSGFCLVSRPTNQLAREESEDSREMECMYGQPVVP